VDAAQEGGPTPRQTVARSARARDQVAKAWMLEILDSTPLAEASDVPVDWLAREAPALIADILRGAADPAAPEGLELPAEGLDRVSELCGLRGDDAPSRLPRDLAALQALLVETLRMEVPERRLGAFAHSVSRLAEVFGDIQGSVTEQLVSERAGGAAADPVTGLPGEAELHEWLRILFAEERRYGHPFALALIDVEGLRHVNQAYGHRAGDRMLAAVAGVVHGQIRAVDRAFRLRDDELCLLAPHSGSSATRRMAQRLCDLVDRSQTADGPRVAIAAGVAACPEHADDADSLLAAAEEAAFAAKAAGRPIEET
jgi:diguanylate cyclase (GGDEF)-like protein